MTRPDGPSAQRHPWFGASGTPRVLAHRGLVSREDAGHGVVENSFAAIAAAHAAGVRYVESDCHVTRDGTVVLFHDEDLSRVTGDPRAVAGVSTRELEALMATRGGLVTLQQALDAFPTLRFNLDVKADAAADPVGRIVGRHGARVLLTSFSDDRRLAALRAADRTRGSIRPATSGGVTTIRRLLTAVTMHSRRRAAKALAGIDALQIPERHGRVRVLSRRLVDVAHALDVEVHVWTVNEPDDMRRLVEAGVDGVVTDRADLALSILR